MRKKFIALLVLIVIFLSTSVVFADQNPNVTIVNPMNEDTLYSDNLLISVKLTEPITVKVSVTQVFKVVNSANVAITTIDEYKKTLVPESSIDTEQVTFATLDPFTSTNNLSFYTKKLENVKPGIYIISVNTIDTEGNAMYTNTNVVSMRPKEENPNDPASFDTPQSGTTQFLKGLLKSIFGN